MGFPQRDQRLRCHTNTRPTTKTNGRVTRKEKKTKTTHRPIEEEKNRTYTHQERSRTHPPLHCTPFQSTRTPKTRSGQSQGAASLAAAMQQEDTLGPWCRRRSPLHAVTCQTRDFNLEDGSCGNGGRTGNAVNPPMMFIDLYRTEHELCHCMFTWRPVTAVRYGTGRVPVICSCPRGRRRLGGAKEALQEYWCRFPMLREWEAPPLASRDLGCRKWR